MPIHYNTRFNDPFLNDALDFSRYPSLKIVNAKSSTPYDLRPPVRERVGLLTYSKRGSPLEVIRSRNVSEPQLVSSTNYMRESWFTNFASTRTVGDIAHLSGDGGILPAHCYQTLATTSSCLRSNDDSDGQLQKMLHTVYEDSSGVPESVESCGYTGGEDSFYSMDSADQDAHPLLLSIPIIPKIKLERKATIRNFNPSPSSDATQNRSFLSPRIRDLRTPARMSSRRHGRIHPRTGSPALTSDGARTSDCDYDPLSFAARTRQSKTKLGSRSVSEPLLNATYQLDDEKESLSEKDVSESPHSDLLLSMIDEVGSSPGSNSDLWKSISPEHSKRGHPRSSVTNSISFANIIHAVADGRSSLDLLLRNKPKTELKSTTKHDPPELGPNAHDPTSKWAAKHGQIVIKVFVPSADDIWIFRVPQDIVLADFTSRVVNKLGFSVSFSGSLWDEPRYYFKTDDQFKGWVKGRVRFGRNLPIVAHIPPLFPFVKLSMDKDERVQWHRDFSVMEASINTGTEASPPQIV